MNLHNLSKSKMKIDFYLTFFNVTILFLLIYLGDTKNLQNNER